MAGTLTKQTKPKKTTATKKKVEPAKPTIYTGADNVKVAAPENYVNQSTCVNGRSEKIDEFLRTHLSDVRYYNFWEQFTKQIPLAFDRPSSSSGKYHQNSTGHVDSLEEHTLELMLFVDKLARIFGDSKQEQFYDPMLLAAALHDVQKYGERNQAPHTTKEHGRITADAIRQCGTEYGLTPEEVDLLAGLILYHDGRWNSTNPGYKPIVFTQLQMFLHIADMASSRRILKFD
jgi:hypothetical protein